MQKLVDLSSLATDEIVESGEYTLTDEEIEKLGVESISQVKYYFKFFINEDRKIQFILYFNYDITIMNDDFLKECYNLEDASIYYLDDFYEGDIIKVDIYNILWQNILLDVAEI